MPVRARSRVFEVDQELAGVLGQRAQLVEFGIEAGANTPPSRTIAAGSGATARVSRSRQASAWPSRRAVRQQQAGVARMKQRAPAGAAPAAACRPSRRLARSRGRADSSAMRVVMRSMSGTSPAWRTGRPQHRAGPARRSPHGARARRAGRARVVQPVAQQARTHRGAAVIEQREQRRRLLAADGLRQFQVAAGGGVQADEFVFGLDRSCARAAGRGPGSTAHNAAARRPRRKRRPGHRRQSRSGWPRPVASSSALWPRTTSKCQSGTRWVWAKGFSANMSPSSRAGSRPARCVRVPAPGARPRCVRRRKIPSGAARRWPATARPGRR
jgi:hypothetical protein